MLEDLVNATIDDKYRIESLLGVGGMGAVFHATHEGTGRPVALKIITPEYAADEQFVERFRREARAAGRFRHPNIVDVTDFGFSTVDGRRIAYLVMEYLNGCSLEDVLEEEGRLSLEWVAEFFEQLAMAIDEAHNLGIVHRDLKPSNIWLEPNLRGGFRVKVLDFGLARIVRGEGEDAAPASAPVAATLLDASSPRGTAAEAETVVAGAPESHTTEPAREPATTRVQKEQLTRAGTVMGTPQYMSPEQCMGKPVGYESDIYSLGVILYQTLTGTLPFEGDVHTLLMKHVTERPETPRVRCPDVPEPVSELVEMALEKEPSRRPPSAGTLAAKLKTRSESPWQLLRRGLATAAEEYPTLFRVVALALVPYLVADTLQFVATRVARIGAMTPGLGEAVTLALAIAELTTLTLGAIVARGLIVLLLAQHAQAPQRAVRVDLVFSTLGRYLGPALVGALVTMVAVYVPLGAFWMTLSFGEVLWEAGSRGAAVALWALSLGLAALGAKAWIDLLLYPVAILAEGLSVRAALRRSRELAARLRADSLVIGLATLAIYMSHLAFSPLLDMHDFTGLYEVLEFGFGVLLRLLVMPISAALIAVLYIKLRLTAGEPLEDLLEQQYVREELPVTQWQKRLVVPVRTSGDRTQ